jgi:eukaryotic-like serine/threonine-protein kinase
MARLASGTSLGPYQVVAPLGAGGMGEVYRAHDARLGRDVALKVLPEALAADPERLARFEREARTVAVLNHPHIVTIHSIEQAGPVRFLTMELVEGDSLDRLLVPTGLPVLRVLKWALALADALAAAHERGIVHRDLKPANVMITRDDRVKVLDFGLARVDEGPGADSDPSMETQALTVQSPVSADGLVVGTAPYMSPEQIRGEKVDARADLFALGIVLHEMLAGRRPFAGRTLPDLTSSILRDTPASLRSLRSEVPLPLDRLVGRCLEKDRERRHATAREVRAELEAIRRELESGVQSGAGGASGAPAVAPSLAVLPFANMSADPENEFFSDGLTEELLNVLARNPGLRVVGRTSSFAFKGKQEDLREIGQKLGVATLLEGSVRKAGNRVRITVQLVKVSDGFHLWSETFDRVLDDIFAVQDEIAKCVSLAMNVTLLGTPVAAPAPRNAETYELLLHAGHLAQQQTDSTLARAVELYLEAIARVPDDARAWTGLAYASVTQYYKGAHGGDPDEKYRQAREAIDRAVALDPNLAEAWETLGMILGPIEFRWAESLDAIRKACALAPGSGRLMMSLATFTGALGNVAEAVSLSERAVALDPLSATTVLNRARVLYWARHYRESVAVYLRALELSPDISSGWAQLAMAYALMGRLPDALAAAAKEQTPGYRLWAQATAYELLGDRAASDAALAALIAGGEHWAFQVLCVHAVRGEMDEAFRWLDKAHEVHDAGLALALVNPALDGLRAEPRWLPFAKRLGLLA